MSLFFLFSFFLRFHFDFFIGFTGVEGVEAKGKAKGRKAPAGKTPFLVIFQSTKIFIDFRNLKFYLFFEGKVSKFSLILDI